MAVSMRQAKDAGKSYDEIAQAFGLPTSTVIQVIEGLRQGKVPSGVYTYSEGERWDRIRLTRAVQSFWEKNDKCPSFKDWPKRTAAHPSRQDLIDEWGDIVDCVYDCIGKFDHEVDQALANWTAICDDPKSNHVSRAEARRAYEVVGMSIPF